MLEPPVPDVPEELPLLEPPLVVPVDDPLVPDELDGLVLEPVVPDGVAVPGPEVVPEPDAPMPVLPDAPMPVLLVLLPGMVDIELVLGAEVLGLVELVLLEERPIDWHPAARAATTTKLSAVRGR